MGVVKILGAWLKICARALRAIGLAPPCFLDTPLKLAI
jgi:hypothetical protein